MKRKLGALPSAARSDREDPRRGVARAAWSQISKKSAQTEKLAQITLNMHPINLGVSESPRQSSVAILKGNDISR